MMCTPNACACLRAATTRKLWETPLLIEKDLIETRATAHGAYGMKHHDLLFQALCGLKLRCSEPPKVERRGVQLVFVDRWLDALLPKLVPITDACAQRQISCHQQTRISKERLKTSTVCWLMRKSIFKSNMKPQSSTCIATHPLSSSKHQLPIGIAIAACSTSCNLRICGKPTCTMQLQVDNAEARQRFEHL